MTEASQQKNTPSAMPMRNPAVNSMRSARRCLTSSMVMGLYSSFTATSFVSSIVCPVSREGAR